MTPRVRSHPHHRARRLVVLAVLLLATRAEAGELVVGATSDYTYNSNFFSGSQNEDAANSFLIGPTLEISDEAGRLAYDISYAGAYQAYVDQSGVDAWESRLRGRATYRIDPRTSIRIIERFRDVSNLRFSRQDIELADTALDPNQDRYFRNDLELELIHQFSRLVEFRFTGAHHWTDFRDNRDRNDSQAFEVGSEVRYQLAARHDVGIGANYIHQDFQDALSRLGSRVDSINAFLSWSWDLMDNVVFTASGGPSWIQSDEDNTNQINETQFVGGSRGGDVFRADIGSCNPGILTGIGRASNCDFATPGFPAIPAANLGPNQAFALSTGQRAGKDSVVTFFGGAALRANLASWNLQATYSRRQSTTSGAALASSLDRIYMEFEFAPPSSRWSSFLAGSWDRRETLTDATSFDFNVRGANLDGTGAAERVSAFTSVSNSRSRRDNFTAIAGVRGAYTRNASATVEFRYRRTEGRDQNIDRPGVDTYFVVLSVAYTLDPIQF